MQIDNSHVTVWEDGTAKRSQISFEYDAGLGDAWVSFSKGNNGDPVRLSNLAVPVTENDATNKAYVDALIRGLTIKSPVRLLETTNRVLADLVVDAQIDGVALRAGDRIMLVGQTSTVENGIYVVGSGTAAPVRAIDFAIGMDASGAYAFVDEGTVYTDRSFICISNRLNASGQPSAVIGTDGLTFVQFGARSSAMAGRGLVTGQANELDVNVDDTTLVISNDFVCIKNPDIKLKVERGLIRSSTNGTAVSDTATDSTDVAVLGRTVPLGSNITVRPDFTVIPDLAHTNTFTDVNTFSQGTNASWTLDGNGDPVLAGALVLPVGGLAVRQDVIAARAELRATGDSTTTGTGALVVAGGVGVAKALNVGGVTQVYDTTQSVGTTSGALVVNGGAGIASNVYAGGDVHCQATTATTAWSASNPLAGALVVEGGAAVRGDVHCANAAVHSTADATSTSTGALQVSGGLGVASAIWSDTAHAVSTTNSTSTTSGAVVVAGGAGIGRTLYVGENANVTGDVTTATGHVIDTTNSTSTTTGCLQVAGGVGIVKDVYVGGLSHILGDVHCDNTTAAGWTAGTAPMTGALVVEGGAAVRGEVQCATAHMLGTTASTSVTTGAVVVDGGVGVAGDTNIGGQTRSDGAVLCANAASSLWSPGATVSDPPTLSGSLQVTGGAAVAKGFDSLTMHAHGTTDATSTATGTVIVDGGLGVAKSIYAASANVNGGAASTSQTTGALVVTGGLGLSGDLYCQSTYNMSDERLKKNIEVLDGALEQVCAMRGCSFQWNERMPGLENVPSVGVIAQDILRQAPLCVTQNHETDLYAVEYTKLVPYLIESIKTLKRRCDELEAQAQAVPRGKRARKV
jgi:hypothetical protein